MFPTLTFICCPIVSLSVRESYLCFFEIFFVVEVCVDVFGENCLLLALYYCLVIGERKRNMSETATRRTTREKKPPKQYWYEVAMILCSRPTTVT